MVAILLGGDEFLKKSHIIHGTRRHHYAADSPPASGARSSASMDMSTNLYFVALSPVIIVSKCFYLMFLYSKCRIDLTNIAPLRGLKVFPFYKSFSFMSAGRRSHTPLQIIPLGIHTIVVYSNKNTSIIQYEIFVKLRVYSCSVWEKPTSTNTKQCKRKQA